VKLHPSAQWLQGFWSLYMKLPYSAYCIDHNICIQYWKFHADSVLQVVRFLMNFYINGNRQNKVIGTYRRLSLHILFNNLQFVNIFLHTDISLNTSLRERWFSNFTLPMSFFYPSLSEIMSTPMSRAIWRKLAPIDIFNFENSTA